MKDTLISTNRRKFILGLGAGSLLVPGKAMAQFGSGGFLSANENGLKPNIIQNQSTIFNSLIKKAANLGLPLFVGGGKYYLSNIDLPSNITIIGVLGATKFVPVKNETIFGASGQKNITINNIIIDGANIAKQNLIHFYNCYNILLEKITLKNGGAGAIYLEKCQGEIAFCNISNIKRAAIHSQDSQGMNIYSNKIHDCKNGGILVWRYQNGEENSIISNNKISKIGSESGSGQNGNGINLYQCDEAIISNNIISDCAFSAIRVNSTNNIIINSNICTNCQEVAIFSEFAFSGSIISDNIIDEAALGISVSNFDYDGRLAIISNNIVRNIWQYSPTNKDVRPTGIYAEADTIIEANLVENVPGIGIVAGWGPYLRNMLVLQNIIRNTNSAIAVSVVKGVGRAKIANNIISNAKINNIIGMEWTKYIGEDLINNPNQFPNHIIEGNITG